MKKLLLFFTVILCLGVSACRKEPELDVDISGVLSSIQQGGIRLHKDDAAGYLYYIQEVKNVGGTSIQLSGSTVTVLDSEGTVIASAENKADYVLAPDDYVVVTDFVNVGAAVTIGDIGNIQIKYEEAAAPDGVVIPDVEVTEASMNGSVLTASIAAKSDFSVSELVAVATFYSANDLYVVSERASVDLTNASQGDTASVQFNFGAFSELEEEFDYHEIKFYNTGA